MPPAKRTPQSIANDILDTITANVAGNTETFGSSMGRTIGIALTEFVIRPDILVNDSDAKWDIVDRGNQIQELSKALTDVARGKPIAEFTPEVKRSLARSVRTAEEMISTLEEAGGHIFDTATPASASALEALNISRTAGDALNREGVNQSESYRQQAIAIRKDVIPKLRELAKSLHITLDSERGRGR